MKSRSDFLKASMSNYFLMCATGRHIVSTAIRTLQDESIRLCNIDESPYKYLYNLLPLPAAPHHSFKHSTSALTSSSVLHPCKHTLTRSSPFGTVGYEIGRTRNPFLMRNADRGRGDEVSRGMIGVVVSREDEIREGGRERLEAGVRKEERRE